jgi:hypothetical protein
VQRLTSVAGWTQVACRSSRFPFVMLMSTHCNHNEDITMRYTLLLHYPEMTAEDIGQAGIEEGQAEFHAYAEALDQAGVLVSAEVLQPSASTTRVSVRDGRAQVQDGPFADTREQLGGTFVIDVPDLDAALAWAEKCPSAPWGTIEIRPSAVRFVDGGWVACV